MDSNNEPGIIGSRRSVLEQEIRSHLATHSLAPNSAWLENNIPALGAGSGVSGSVSGSGNVNVSGIPASTLCRTALFRILASDITLSLDRARSAVLPCNVVDPCVQERVLLTSSSTTNNNSNNNNSGGGLRSVGPVVVQVLDVEDIQKSRWTQVQALERVERGEMVRGREMLRLHPAHEEELRRPGGAKKKHGTHKLLLQDIAGTRIYGFELKAVDGIGVDMNIGTKLLLRDVTVARGVVLLEPRTVQVLGGKIDSLHNTWHEGRKQRLTAAARAVDE